MRGQLVLIFGASGSLFLQQRGVERSGMTLPSRSDLLLEHDPFR
jgi:hypothetical protein